MQFISLHVLCIIRELTLMSIQEFTVAFQESLTEIRFTVHRVTRTYYSKGIHQTL